MSLHQIKHVPPITIQRSHFSSPPSFRDRRTNKYKYLKRQTQSRKEICSTIITRINKEQKRHQDDQQQQSKTQVY